MELARGVGSEHVDDEIQGWPVRHNDRVSAAIERTGVLPR
jgi:hypothetical protein